MFQPSLPKKTQRELSEKQMTTTALATAAAAVIAIAIAIAIAVRAVIQNMKIARRRSLETTATTTMTRNSKSEFFISLLVIN